MRSYFSLPEKGNPCKNFVKGQLIGVAGK